MKKTAYVLILALMAISLNSCGADSTDTGITDSGKAESVSSEEYSEAFICPENGNDTVKLLKEADENSDVLLDMKMNDPVMVVSLHSQWAYVKWQGVYGYVPVTRISFEEQVTETTEATTVPVTSEVTTTAAAVLNEYGVYDPEKNYGDFEGYSHAVLGHMASGNSLFMQADSNADKCGDFSENQTVFIWGTTGKYSYISNEEQNVYGYIPSELILEGAYVPPVEEKYTAYFTKEEIFNSAGVSDGGAHVVGGVVSNLTCDNGEAYADTSFLYKYDLLESITVANAKKGNVNISGDITIYGLDMWNGETVSYEVESGHFSVNKTVG